MKTRVIQPNQPHSLVFHNGKNAIKVTAYGLVGNDCLTFRLVQQTAERNRFEGRECVTYLPTPEQISQATNYRVGDCEPTLHAKRNIIYIVDRGSYLPVLHGSESAGSLIVEVEPVNMGEFSKAQLGIDPCGCLCVETNWTFTGNERIDLRDDVEIVLRELVSNCGNKKWSEYRLVKWWETGITRCKNNKIQIQEQSERGVIRWQETEEVCGVSPSVPIIIDDCGCAYIGYLFHANEPRDPLATVAISDCDQIVGYAYERAGQGRTLAIKDCNGKIYGYAANRSNTAPEFKPNGVCNGCDCSEMSDDEQPPLIIEPPLLDNYVCRAEPLYDDNRTFLLNQEFCYFKDDPILTVPADMVHHIGDSAVFGMSPAPNTFPKNFVNRVEEVPTLPNVGYEPDIPNVGNNNDDVR